MRKSHKARPEAVSVNGRTISSQAIAAETQNHRAPRQAAQSVWDMATNALIVRELLLQEAKRRGIAAVPLEVAPGRFETDEEACVRALLDSAVTVKAVEDKDVRAEWEKDPGRFRTQPLWEVSHILLACDHRQRDPRLAALHRCKSLLSELADDAGAFKRLAETHSDCDSREHGGFLGQLRPRDALPEFEAALRCLKEGEITKRPVRSRHGFHIVRLEAEVSGRVLPYDAVRRKIALAMEKVRWAKAASAFANELAKKAEITGFRSSAELPN